MTKVNLSDSEADYVCMEEAVKAFEKLSRHHYTEHDSDSVAVSHGTQARLRVLQWLVRFIEEHPCI